MKIYSLVVFTTIVSVAFAQVLTFIPRLYIKDISSNLIYEPESCQFNRKLQRVVCDFEDKDKTQITLKVGKFYDEGHCLLGQTNTIRSSEVEYIYGLTRWKGCNLKIFKNGFNFLFDSKQYRFRFNYDNGCVGYYNIKDEIKSN